MDESARSIILTVAALITTATYQAALTPPGGYWQDDSSNSTVVTANSSGIAAEKPHQAGKIILAGKALYKFMALNSTVFLASILTIWITAIPLLPHTCSVYLLITILGYAYFSTATIGFPKSDTIEAILLGGIYSSMLVAVLVVPFFLWLAYHKFRVKVDATGRRVGSLPGWKDRK